MDQGTRRSAPPRTDDVISDQRFERYHRFARERGTSRPLYYLARVVLVPFFLIWFRLERTGREHARFKGGMIVASNHRSFLDPFVIGALLPWRRRMQFVAKVELFEKRWQGWALSRLGAFPIRRGRVGRNGDGDRPDGGRTRRDGGDLPRGNADQDRFARASEARGGQACTRDRRCGAPGRGLRLGRGPPRLAGAPAQGQAAGRQAGDRASHRAALAGSGGDDDRPDLAQHRAAVGVARGPASASQGGGDRRGQLGNGGRRPARSRRPRGRARHSHRGQGAGDPAASTRTSATCRASSCRPKWRSSAPARSSSPAAI